MKYYYLITVQIAYKEKDKNEIVEDMYPLFFNFDNPLTFNSVLLAELERKAVIDYFARNKIEVARIEKSTSQLIAVSSLGQMEEFFVKTPTEKEIN